MTLFRHITVISISEQEKADFLEAGVAFKKVTKRPRGECAIFEIGEDDSRWERVAALIASLEERDGIPKKYRVQSLSMTAPTWKSVFGRLRNALPPGRSRSRAPNGWSIQVKARTSYSRSKGSIGSIRWSWHLNRRSAKRLNAKACRAFLTRNASCWRWKHWNEK